MVESNIFSEDKYYSEYKRIRNQFRKYQPYSIIHGCVDYIYSPIDEEFGECRKMPWLVLLLVKWVLLDENHNSNSKKLINNEQLWKILNSIHGMAKYARMPDQYDHHILFLRNIAYQQFIYQRQFSINHLSRQHVLFGDLQDNNLIRTKFEELTGVEIEDFLELSIATLVRFVDRKEKNLPATWLSTMSHHYSPSVIDKFYKCISSTMRDIKISFVSKDNGNRLSEEYYEQTPFQKFPIIADNKEYLCIHPMVLFRALENYVYDKLRDWDSQVFMGKFGPIFEKYVEKSIRYTGHTLCK